MCAAVADFISNNDNHSATQTHEKRIKIVKGEHVFRKEKKKQQLFASVRIFCPTDGKTYFSFLKIKNFSFIKNKRT